MRDAWLEKTHAAHVNSAGTVPCHTEMFDEAQILLIISDVDFD